MTRIVVTVEISNDGRSHSLFASSSSTRLCQSKTSAQVIGKQLLRSGTSVGAHYSEASRSRSPAEFISKIEGGLQELDETDYWIDLLIECNLVPSERLAPLKQEISELLAMLTASVKTVKNKRA